MNRYSASPAEIDSRLAELEAEIARLQAERKALADEFTRRGGWTRAFAVPGGHVHQSTACSSCYPTTAFAWLPQVSGLDEAEIVDLAGERACTVCYPSAPVDVLKKASRLFSAAEAKDADEKAALAAERAEKAAAKAAKAIVDVDGRPLRGKYGCVVASERTAEIEAVDCVHDAEAYGYEFDAVAFARLVGALAAKRNVHPDEVEALVREKAAKKVAKTRREMARY